jgi:hypothetical protein
MESKSGETSHAAPKVLMCPTATPGHERVWLKASGSHVSGLSTHFTGRSTSNSCQTNSRVQLPPSRDLAPQASMLSISSSVGR